MKEGLLHWTAELAAETVRRESDGAVKKQRRPSSPSLLIRGEGGGLSRAHIWTTSRGYGVRNISPSFLG